MEREQREAEARVKKLEEERLLRVCDTSIYCEIVCFLAINRRSRDEHHSPIPT